MPTVEAQWIHVWTCFCNRSSKISLLFNIWSWHQSILCPFDVGKTKFRWKEEREEGERCQLGREFSVNIQRQWQCNNNVCDLRLSFNFSRCWYRLCSLQWVWSVPCTVLLWQRLVCITGPYAKKEQDGQHLLKTGGTWKQISHEIC